MKTILALTLFASMSATAFAEEAPEAARMTTDRYLAISAISIDGTFADRGVAIEAAVAVGDSAYSLRGLIAVGKSTDRVSRLVTDPTTNTTLPVYTSGPFELVRVGFEARSDHASGRVFGGIDVGYQSDQHAWGPETARMAENVNAFVTVPRVGLEVGKRICARAALEVPLMEHFDGNGPSAAAAVTLGVGFGF